LSDFDDRLSKFFASRANVRHLRAVLWYRDVKFRRVVNYPKTFNAEDCLICNSLLEQMGFTVVPVTEKSSRVYIREATPASNLHDKHHTGEPSLRRGSGSGSDADNA